jgi:hypothetical protein
MANLPINFEEKIRLPKGQTSGDYPYSIKAKDLMQNFVYAALDADESLIEETVGQGGHAQRRLKIPPLPAGDAIYVLGAVSGELNWIETEDCEVEEE